MYNMKSIISMCKYSQLSAVEVNKHHSNIIYILAYISDECVGEGLWGSYKYSCCLCSNEYKEAINQSSYFGFTNNTKKWYPLNCQCNI